MLIFFICTPETPVSNHIQRQVFQTVDFRSASKSLIVRDLVRTRRPESPSHAVYARFFLSDDSEEENGQAKGIGSIYSDRDANLLKKLDAGEDLYPFCDASVWLRSCSQEVVEPLEGRVTGKSETRKSPRAWKTLISHICKPMFGFASND
jgi:hypothetical protein